MDASKLLPLIGIVIFIAVLLSTGIMDIVDIIIRADPALLLIVLSLQIPVIVIKAGKWKILTHAYGRGASLKECIQSWLVGFVIGIVTPGRMGELSKAYYLKDRISLGRGIGTIVVDRIADISVLFTLAILGTILFIYSGFLEMDIIYLLVTLFVVFIALTLFVLAKGDLVKRFAGPVFRRIVPHRHKPGMRKTFHDFYTGLGDIRRRWQLVAVSVALSFVSWSFAILQYKLIATALSLQIGYLFLLSVMPLVTLLDTLPISFSGLGTREIALIIFLGMLNVSAGEAVSFSVLIFLLGYLVLVPFGLIFWFMKPIKIEF
ncbi:MAG: hypothetical protein DRO99_05185 [Candidatus Aenigmatarchaeota archaeon]|nr:MAG: hypothetical protein DRO99_05185 [Candidatus Aenigmarchaeota archaeon]